MDTTKKTKFIAKCLVALSTIVFLTACSQQISPTGGKRDIIAPKLKTSIPSNKQINYSGKTVELMFDEYIVAENLQQKLQITPDAGEYDVKLEATSLKLVFKKDFEKDNTYSLAFGDAIKDFSEKNPVKNLRVVFSSGAKIDSASIDGMISDIQSGKPMLEVLVGLYKKTDTLNPEKTKPTYFTRTDSAGQFNIENIRPETYILMAIDDKNRSMTYNIKNERFGYIGDSIIVKPNTQMSGVALGLYYTESQPLKTRNSTSRINYYTLNYNKGLEKIKVQFTDPKDSIPFFQSSSSEIQFFNTVNSKDTIRVKTTVVDSSGIEMETIQKIKFKDNKGNAKEISKDKEIFRATMLPNYNDEIDPEIIKYVITFNKPIETYDLTKIKMYSDSTKEEILTPLDFEWSNFKSVLTINKKFVGKKELKISIPKGTFISVENDTLSDNKVQLKIKNEEDYGTIIGNVISNNSDVIIELLDNNFKVIKSGEATEFKFSFVKPGEYYLRAIEDKDKNRKWDSGNFKTKKQPERIKFYQELIKVRKNFILEGLEINLSTK